MKNGLFYKFLILTLIMTVSLFVFAFVGYSAEKPVYGGKLSIALPAEPPGLDPTSNTAAVIDRVVYNNVYEGLVKIDRSGKVVPALAKSWDISKDGLTYIFYLRKGVKFHDGTDFSAADVKYTIERNIKKDTKNAHPEFFRVIKKMEILNDYAIKLTLGEPNFMFLFNLARGDSVIVPEGAGDNLKSHPVGTGPFKFKEWSRGDHITLVRNKDYWNPKLPYLDEVTFKFIPDETTQIAALKAGDIDVVSQILSPEVVPDIESDPNLKVLKGGVTTGDVILAINNSRKPFNDIRVRKAISYAINRKDVIDGAMFGYGTPIGSHMSPANPYYVDLTWLYPYNPKKAKELLKEAGYPNGFSAVIKLPAPYKYSVKSGEVVADLLKDVGINLKIELIEWGQWIQNVFLKADYDLTIIGHAEAFDIGIYSNPKYYFRYDSPEFREVYHRALTTINEDERKKLFAIAQWILASDAVNGFLFEAPALPAMKKNVMNWWPNYPIIAIDVTDVWKAK